MPTSHITCSLDVNIPEGLPLSARDIARFWAKVSRPSDDACWEWTASRFGSLRYGQFAYQVAPGKQKHDYAHRIAWALSHGPIPAGGHICHKCDNPPCCNPDHLFLGDYTANNRDASAKGRYKVPRPKRQKLTDAECDVIVALVKSGTKIIDLAERYGVTKGFVSLLARGKRRQYRKAS